jgi:pimeloyl-ACP methyl ester carboxylesterase
MWIDYKDALVGAGYRVLALDLPGYGSSLHANDVAIDDAVVAGAGLLRDRGAAKVVLVGASMGGTAVVGGAAKAQPPVAGVISLSGPATFAAVHADDLARQLAVPALFAACDGDGSFANDARSMYQVTPAAVPRQLVVDSCVAHGVDMLRTSDPVKAAVTAFLAKYAPA